MVFQGSFIVSHGFWLVSMVFQGSFIVSHGFWFKIQVESVFKKPLTRQKTEAVKIQSSRATHIMNSKAEHRQPAMLRVRMTRENYDEGTNNGQRQGGRGRAGRGGGAVRRVGD